MSSNATLRKIKYALRFIPDRVYIQMYYFSHFKHFADLKNPKTYNEKLNWLKLHDHNPQYIKMVDKYEVKEYVAGIIGNEYIIPTLGVWDQFDEIAQKGEFMKTGLKKQEKTTDIWFDEKDPLIHIRTHNTDLKNRLTAYSRRFPSVCKLTDSDPETGCMEFEIAKGRFSFRLTAPYSEERRQAASDYAKKHGISAGKSKP